MLMFSQVCKLSYIFLNNFLQVWKVIGPDIFVKIKEFFSSYNPLLIKYAYREEQT